MIGKRSPVLEGPSFPFHSTIFHLGVVVGKPPRPQMLIFCSHPALDPACVLVFFSHYPRFASATPIHQLQTLRVPREGFSPFSFLILFFFPGWAPPLPFVFLFFFSFCFGEGW